MNNFNGLKPILKHFAEVGPAGCSASVSLGGKTVFAHCEGYANLETQAPIREDTIFRMYSNSKVATMVAVLTLYEEGLLLLNDPVEKYLPEFANPQVGYYTGNNLYAVRPAKSSILVKDLMTMSSGLTYGSVRPAISETHAAVAGMMAALEARGGYALGEFVKLAARLPLLYDPGTSWNYSISHDVLGALVEAVSGKAFGSYLRERVFEPLGMHDTGFFLRPEDAQRLATLYTRNPDGALVPNFSDEYRYKPEHRYESGGGGLLSTLPDMTRLAQMLSQGGTLDGVRVLGRKTIDLMRTNHLGTEQLCAFRRAHENQWEFLKGYGYGLGVRTMMDRAEGGCNGTRGEFGWAGAAGTWMLMDPEEKLAVVYMHQLKPMNMEGYCHPRIRAAVYAGLD